jgi:hypothetical protein
VQHFLAGAAVVVQHSYKPVVGGRYLAATYSGASNINRSAAVRTSLRIAAYKKSHPPNTRNIVLYENRIQYSPTTANNWSGPIGSFHLGLDADSPEDIVVACRV